MVEVAAIMQATQADAADAPGALVLIDELGRGTSVTDGHGVAAAVAESIVRQPRALTLFATHLHTVPEIVFPGVAEGAVGNLQTVCDIDAGAGSVEMRYKLKPGRAGRSFGLEIAATVGFPADVLAQARKISDLSADLISENVRLPLTVHDALSFALASFASAQGPDVEAARQAVAAALKDAEAALAKPAL
jgi:DNA mismatch repair ATPase MutS